MKHMPAGTEQSLVRVTLGIMCSSCLHAACMYWCVDVHQCVGAGLQLGVRGQPGYSLGTIHFILKQGI